jgi:CRISPR-associated protein Cas2
MEKLVSPPYISRFSAYRAMWLFVFYDLPTETKKERRCFQQFRNALMKDGFSMHQYSIYVRHCASAENADVHEARVRKAVPEKGKISILRITDKQYGNIINIWGRKASSMPSGGSQLEIF